MRRRSGASLLAVDLFCGLGGWTEALLAEGWDVIGFDLERHVYGAERYPAQLVLQDVRTLHGSQFRHVDLIVASPPCQAYSYMAMPWKRAKQIAGALREELPFPAEYDGPRTVAELNALFDACFRIQREAIEAAGRHIPMVVENVKGAQPWVGKARAHYGSFYLWGDVDSIGGRIVRAGATAWGTPSVSANRRRMKRNPDGTAHPAGSWFAIADSEQRGLKVPDNNAPRLWKDREVQRLGDALKNGGNGTWFGQSHGQEYPGQPGNARDGVKVGDLGWNGGNAKGFNVTAVQRYREEQGTKQNGSGAEWFDKALDERRKQATAEGAKCGGGWFGSGNDQSLMRQHNSKRNSRKAASAQIAKIPYPLAEHIARVFKP